MKQALLFAGIFLFALRSMAQFPTGGKPQAAPSIGHIYGKVVDSIGKPISQASVFLMQNHYDTATKKKKDILVKGLTTGNEGEFSFEDLPIFGAYKLKISATGFKNIEQQVAFQMKMDAGASAPKPNSDPSAQMKAMGNMLNAFDKDLGNIHLKDDAAQLQNVTVTSSTPTLKMDIDKKVFNVEKNIVSAGGTALDVMRNVPSVQVDIDGNVKMRNATPQLYVDGRPTTLSLDQIPADAIESVEVITNPSAKFDASGGNAGILNIVLKKNRKKGYNGNLTAGVDKRGGFNAGGNFNLRQNKVNFTAAMFANVRHDYTDGKTNRITQGTGDTSFTAINQNDVSKTNGQFIFGSLGMDYFITNRTTLSIAGITVHGKFKPSDVIDINQLDSLFSQGKILSYSQRLSNSVRNFDANGLTLGMKHNFPKEGEMLTADFNYFSGINSSNAFYTTNYYDKPGGNIDGTQYQKVLADGTNTFMTIQTDYTKPFKGKTKLETGLRAQLRQTTNNNETYIQYTNTPDYIKIPSATNNYKNHDNVFAAYVSFTSSIKDFGYQIGLRAESSDYKGELTNITPDSVFKNTYPISLFPSLFLSQKLNNKQELQFSYTRRINRPNFFQLIPYTDYSDSLNITKGNPNLVPEFTNSAEFSYSKTFQHNHNILASIYYKYTTDLITRYYENGTNPVTGKSDIISTYINANSSYSYGAELTATDPIAKWWDLTTNINIYNSKINVTDTSKNVESASQDALWSWFGKLNSTFKLPKSYSIQLTADYQSKTNLPINNGGQSFGPPSTAQSASQGYIKPYWGVDVAFKKTFLKNNAATVTLIFSDIFRTRKSDQFSYGPGFIQQYDRLSNPQMIRLNFSYRFGKLDTSLFKRKNLNSSGSSDAMQMQ